MAKCPICNSKKGKRKCLIADSDICALCCAEKRNPDSCLECQFYQKPKRNYSDVPAYSVSQMDRDPDLESYSNAIEGAICAFDVANDSSLKDSNAIKIVELLIDIYHFGDRQTERGSKLITNGLDYVEAIIKQDLHDVDHEIIVKILGAIRFVARRRTKTGREYMDIIHQYVGQRIEKGLYAKRM